MENCISLLKCKYIKIKEEIIMSVKDRQYEDYKNYLKGLNLSWQEYEKRIREWCKKNNY